MSYPHAMYWQVHLLTCNLFSVGSIVILGTCLPQNGLGWKGPWAGMPFTRSCCPGPHPAWPCTLTGMRQPQSSVSSVYLQKRKCSNEREMFRVPTPPPLSIFALPLPFQQFSNILHSESQVYIQGKEEEQNSTCIFMFVISTSEKSQQSSKARREAQLLLRSPLAE